MKRPLFSSPLKARAGRGFSSSRSRRGRTPVTAAHLAGLKGATLHSLRHSAATWALAGGSDVRTVSAILGHSAPSTTLNVYGHVVAGLQSRAVASLGNTLSRAQARRSEAKKTGAMPAQGNQMATVTPVVDFAGTEGAAQTEVG